MSATQTKRSHPSPSYADAALFIHRDWQMRKADSMNIAVEHWEEIQIKDPKTKKPTGKTRWDWKVKGFHSTIGGALRGITKDIGFVCTDLRDCMERIDALHKDIARAGV